MTPTPIPDIPTLTATIQATVDFITPFLVFVSAGIVMALASFALSRLVRAGR